MQLSEDKLERISNVMSRNRGIQFYTDEHECEEPDLSSFPPRSSPEPLGSPKLFSSSPQVDYRSSPPSSPPPMDLEPMDSFDDLCVPSHTFDPCGDLIIQTGSVVADPVDETSLLKVSSNPISEASTTSLDGCSISPLGPAADPADPAIPLDKPEKSDNSDTLDRQSQATFPPPRPPNPIRFTQASRRLQLKKLTTPFRSPLRSDALQTNKGKVYSTPITPSTDGQMSANEQDTKRKPPTGQKERASKVAQYTEGAAKQFRSPFTADPKGQTTAVLSPLPSGPKLSFTSATSVIQALQTRVQKLKQAIKIKNGEGGEEDAKLEALAQKWKAVAREVAWEVWETVKDLGTGTVGYQTEHNGWDHDNLPAQTGTKRRVDDSWEYGSEVKRARLNRYDESEEETENGLGQSGADCEKNGHTLGTMLRYMGIAPDTLGWDEEEGDFVDL